MTLSPQGRRGRFRARHFWLGLVIVVCGVTLGHTVYVKVKTCTSSVGCTMSWLSTQLQLTPEQYAWIEALHKEHAAALLRLKQKAGGKEPRPESCKAETKAFIEKVCAELNPEQRKRYLELVAPCTKERERKL